MDIPLGGRFPISQVYGRNGSLPTLTRFPIQNLETKKNSVFHFLSNVGRDLRSALIELILLKLKTENTVAK